MPRTPASPTAASGSDLVLSLFLSATCAAWVATVHTLSAPGVPWGAWAADAAVTGVFMEAATLSLLLLLRRRDAAHRRHSGRVAQVVVAVLGVAAVAAGTTPVRMVLVTGSPGHAYVHGVLANVFDHVLLTLAAAVPLAMITALVAAPDEPTALEPVPFGPTQPVVIRVRTRARARARRRSSAALVGTAALVAALLAGTPSVAQATSSPVTDCLAGNATPRSVDVVAIDVDITVNAFGDHDPGAHMYALADAVPAIRAQESSRKVTPGLRDDPIQPLVVRANVGDCVEIHYTNNATGGSYGLHIDGLAFSADGSGDAIGANPSSAPAPGESRTYRYYVPTGATTEGLHYLHPGPGFRAAVDHGLFGALAVEPAGSTYWDANTPNTPLKSGWEAIIRPGGATSSCNPATRACEFREANLLHHEIGNDNESLTGANGELLPVQDDTTGSYRPGAFALNYRSEPFRNRLLKFPKEKSHAYSSYTFGDPATPIIRGYLADPTKIRILHAGGEKFHVYHLHGGGDRWRADPVADATFNYADTGLQKDPATTESPSQRNDSQSLGPGESFNLEIEGGAGGVQQSVGDFLYHCHIAKHYLSGMWSLWRVYNVRQPDFVPLSDRAAPAKPVESTGLLGRTYVQRSASGATTSVTLSTPAKLDSWIRQQLPPQGVPKTQDASVWDWKVAGTTSKPVYLGAPADPTVFPDSPRGESGQPNLLAVDNGHALHTGRPRLLFDPVSGRPAYPMLRPQIGKRPPFSGAGHTGTPYLSNTANAAATSTVDPTSGRKDGLCPTGAGRTLRTYNVVAIEKAYARTGGGVIDQEGKVFVLAKDKPQVLDGTKPVTPLAIRANQGDCVAITLTNEMTDANAFDNFSKTSMHIHHVQFDVQGSDGVSAGFAYEHSVRPYKVEDPTLTAAASAGSTTITVSSVTKFIGKDANGKATKPWLMVGQGTSTPEIRQVVAVNPVTRKLTLNAALTSAHPGGQFAGTEFIQYRWYPDVVLDNVFWHDHVDGIHGWGHGLVGQLIVEPRGSLWLDPTTNLPVDSGTFVNIVPGPASEPFDPGVVDGAFRELVLWTVNDNDQSAFSTINLRANPFTERPVAADRFSSYTYGDPVTPLARIYPNEPLVVRALNVSPTVDTLHFQGARWAPEFRYDEGTGSAKVGLTDTLHAGVSERFTAVLNGQPAEERLRPGDYLYFDGNQDRFTQGAWGVVRVLPKEDPNLPPLPGIPGPGGTYTEPTMTGQPAPDSSDPGNPCTPDQPVRSWNITAAQVTAPAARVQNAFVPSNRVLAKGKTPVTEPLVLHAVAGDCLKVHFTNALGTASGFSLAGVDREQGSSGVTVGWGTNQSVAPGATRDYVYSVNTDRLDTVTISDLVGGPASMKGGLYGALVIAPRSTVAGSPTRFTDPVTGVARDVGSKVVVHVPGWRVPDYRDFTVMLADDDVKIGQDFMPYPTDAVADRVNINYGSAPVGDGNTSFANPGTSPVLTAFAGDPTVVHALVAPGSEQAHSFSLGGLSWQKDWREPASNEISAVGVGPWESADALITGGAGGVAASPGDYFYGDLRRPFTQVGLWGLQRVLPSDGSGGCPVLTLTGLAC